MEDTIDVRQALMERTLDERQHLKEQPLMEKDLRWNNYNKNPNISFFSGNTKFMQNCANFPKLRVDPFWTIWYVFSHFEPFWAVLNYFGQFWKIWRLLNFFLPFCTIRIVLIWHPTHSPNVYRIGLWTFLIVQNNLKDQLFDSREIVFSRQMRMIAPTLS